MKRVFQIAVREFVATAGTRAFIIGLLIMPALIVLGVILGPRLFNFQNFKVEGEVAVIDLSGKVTAELRAAVDPKAIAARRTGEIKQVLSQSPKEIRELAEGAPLPMTPPVPDIRIAERPSNADVEQEKAWLNAPADGARHLALVVIHRDAVEPADGRTTFGNYDLYYPPNLDDRVDSEIQQNIREAIINARIRTRELDRQAIDSIVRVPRVRSVTVTSADERQTVRGLNILLPVSVAALLFVGVMTGGQALLTSTVEEKSSRVMEVLLSAVSPMQLMAGKILGQMAVSMLVMSLYIVMGLGTLASFSLFGLFDPWLIFYLLIFFVIMYLVCSSLMMAIGSAVNDMKEAQSLMMPIMLIIILPWMLWMPISRDPNSTFSVVLSFLPPVNTFTMLLRMASSTPPPWWQVWLSILVGVGSVFAALWFTAKIFRIGLLMYGKPPNFATLIRWVRAA